MPLPSRVSFRTVTVSALLAAIALLAFVAWTLYVTTRDAVRSAGLVYHSEEVLRVLETFRGGYDTVAAGQRGYLLYGLPMYLQQRDQAIERARTALARLAELTADNPVQRDRALELGKLLAQRVEHVIADTAAAATMGIPAPMSPERRARTELTSVQVLQVAGALEFMEMHLLNERRRVDAVRQSRAGIVIAGAFVLCAGMLLLAFGIIVRESRRRQRAQLQMTEIVEGLPVTVWQMETGTDGQRRFVYVGAGADELRGATVDELLADMEGSRAGLDPDERAALEEAMRTSERQLVPLDFDYRLPPRVTHDGERWVHKHAQVRRRADGTLLWTGYWSDITRQKQLEQALREAVDAANLANRAKSTFLATMSHEIRTPMTGVMGLLELLGLTRLDGEQRSTLTVIRESARSLLRIIDDILDFSRIEEGRMTLAPVPASVRDAIQRACNIHGGIASSRGLLLEQAVDPRLSAAHVFDPLRLGQILNNFISNAVKFTEEGGVQVAAELLERVDDSERIRLTVTDTGIGVPPETAERLFQPFTQGGPQITSTYGGSGLGLAICRRLAHLMGGTVAMQSTLGRGTRMVLDVEFPVADAADVALNGTEGAERRLTDSVAGRRMAPTAEAAEAEGTLVLVVDDHPTNRLVLCRQVVTLGYGAIVAEDGVEALALWRSRRIGLVLTDSNMPNMNGYELARAVRQLEAAQDLPRVPIVACTANAMSSEAARCAAAGMDGCLIKPVDLLELLTVLDAYLPLPEGADGPPALPPPALDGEGVCFDPAVLQMISGGDPAVEHQVLTDFLRTNAEDLYALREAAEVGDLPESSRLAHRMMGAAQTLGARSLLQACRLIEARALSGDADGTRAAVQTVASEAQALERAFRARLGGEAEEVLPEAPTRKPATPA